MSWWTPSDSETVGGHVGSVEAHAGPVRAPPSSETPSPSRVVRISEGGAGGAAGFPFPASFSTRAQRRPRPMPYRRDRGSTAWGGQISFSLESHQTKNRRRESASSSAAPTRETPRGASAGAMTRAASKYVRSAPPARRGNARPRKAHQRSRGCEACAEIEGASAEDVSSSA